MVGLSLRIIRLRLPCWTVQPHFLAVEVRKIMRRCRLIFLNSNSSWPFLCISYVLNFLAACQLVGPYSPWTVLPKISRNSVFESIRPQKKQPNACHYGDKKGQSASGGWWSCTHQSSNRQVLLMCVDSTVCGFRLLLHVCHFFLPCVLLFA